MSDRYEFSRPTADLDDQEVQQDGVVLPKRRTLVRCELPNGQWVTLGWIDLRLVPLAFPPPGHAPVAVAVEVSVNLAAMVTAWDGKDRRAQGERRRRGL